MLSPETGTRVPKAQAVGAPARRQPLSREANVTTPISLTVEMGWRVHQMDVNTAFLNGVIKEEVYIEQSEGFYVENRETHVCILHRALYGLKQAPRAWYLRIDNYLREMGFQRSEVDHNLYFLIGEVPLILVLYVDDLFLIGDERLIGDYKSNLAVEFEMRWMFLHRTGEVCGRDPEEIQDGGLQAYGHTSSSQLEQD